MVKSIIYYTDNRLGEPIFSTCQKYIKEAGLPIVSCTLEPIDFGKNIVLDRTPSIQTMWTQILVALENSEAENVFFCEHDVLYPKEHFDFVPPTDHIFYYDDSVYRWLYGSDIAVTYYRLFSLSGMCCNRNYAIDHYRKRIKMIHDNGWENNTRREPDWARRMGYEPGTKQPKRGGYFTDTFECWNSKIPMVDIRHPGTFSPLKVTYNSFRHPPTQWREIPVEEIPGWKIKEIFPK